MNHDVSFIRSLSYFLAEHTEQPSGYLSSLIEAFMLGAHAHAHLEPAAKSEVGGRLRAEMAAHNYVPSFLHYYLIRHLERELWPSQAAFIASRYQHFCEGRRPERAAVAAAAGTSAPSRARSHMAAKAHALNRDGPTAPSPAPSSCSPTAHSV